MSLMAWACLKCLFQSCLVLEVVSPFRLPGEGPGSIWPFPPGAASWGDMSCLYMVTLPTPRDSTGHGRQDIFQQQELSEQDSTGHTRSQQPGQDGILLPIHTAHQTPEAAGALPAEAMSWKTGVLDGSTPKDGSPRLLPSASAEVQYK